MLKKPTVLSSKLILKVSIFPLTLLTFKLLLLLHSNKIPLFFGVDFILIHISYLILIPVHSV